VREGYNPMDLSTAAHVHDELSERIVIHLPRAMLAVIERVAREANYTPEAVIREYIAESLPDDWLHEAARG